MTNISGLKPLLRYVESFVFWMFEPFYVGDSDILSGPLIQFAEFVLDNTVVFIFVVAVPLLGLGIGILNRILKAN